MNRNLLLTPGPTQIPPALYEVLSRPLIHHRTPQFQEYLRQTISGLQQVLQTKNDVYLMASSGSGAMEASVCSFLSPSDTVITVEGGKFGERWTELAQAFGVKTKAIEVEWGRSVEPKQIKALLDADKTIKSIYLTSCETSTGAATDIEAIGKLVKETEAILVVDAISSLGVVDLQMDNWFVDVVVSGSHKGFMLPPGLSFVAVSEKAKKLMQVSTCPKYYFDLRKYQKVAVNPDTPFTPASGLVIAMAESLRMIRVAGLQNRFKHFQRLASATRQAVRAMGLSLFTEESSLSSVLTAINLPEGIDGQAVVKKMRDSYGIFVAGGQAHLKGKIVRIAHMGCLDEYDMLTGISCLEKVLFQMGYQFNLGSGVVAAQHYFNANK